MSNVIDFSKYKGRTPSGNKPVKRVKEPDTISRCDQVKRLVIGKHVTEVSCVDDENFTLVFDNGAKLNLMISKENDLMNVINIIESNSEDE